MFQVVILTLKRASPQMMRFLMCTLIIYGGFVFCGWLVLGPYHIKVRIISCSCHWFSLLSRSLLRIIQMISVSIDIQNIGKFVFIDQWRRYVCNICNFRLKIDRIMVVFKTLFVFVRQFIHLRHFKSFHGCYLGCVRNN